jgi:NADH-quinone oxidoreductase subunit N
VAIDSSTVSALMPEAILVVAAILVFLGGAFAPSRTVWTLAALAGLGIAALALARTPAALLEAVGGDAGTTDYAWIADRLANVGRVCALLLGALFVIFSTQSRQKHLHAEIVGCILLITVGLMLVTGAADLVLMFVGFELISIPTYVLLFVGRPGRASDEATAKYFYLSLLSSAILLYGFATLYGLAGDTRLDTIQAALEPARSGPFRVLFPVAFLMVLCGFSFKLASVPFHFYAPDVYQATTSLNAALLAVVPKVAGVVGLVRILVIAIPHEFTAVWQTVVVLAVVTMTIANVAALWQSDFRRLMAYSSIAHAGYLLVGLAAALAARDNLGWGPSAVAAMVFYVIAYAAATVGAFASVAYLSDDDESFSKLSQLAGVGRAHPLIGALMAICMFSLSGIPPLAGFLGKFALFRSALDAALPAEGGVNPWFMALCIVGVLNAAIAAAYYLRVIAVMYFDGGQESQSELEVAGNTGAGLAALLSAFLVLSAGLFAGNAMSNVHSAAKAAWPIRMTAEAAKGETAKGKSGVSPRAAAALVSSERAAEVEHGGTR